MTYTFETSTEIINFTYSVILSNQEKQITRHTIAKFAKIILAMSKLRILTVPKNNEDSCSFSSITNLEDEILSEACGLDRQLVSYLYNGLTSTMTLGSDDTNISQIIEYLMTVLKNKGIKITDI